ncbi:MAG: radical SAM protein, partial [Oscillospiraceae bacterium]|nr:radical SAM protein [Oscillospiraceae bacterium]
MKDAFGREISYLRLSVTDLCNLRCVYCMPAEGVKKLRHGDVLSIEELAEIVAAAARCGITKVRVTGGEPLVRRGILELCRKISVTPGISELCLTTNGALLTQFAKPLRGAGVARLNISLDTLDPEKYREITRGGELSDALRGIEAARDAGFDNIKINAVLIGGVNGGGARELIELTRGGVCVRFIELMPIGECAAW